MTSASPTIPAGEPQRFDTTTIALHWLTAVLVVVLFVSGMASGVNPGLRGLQSVHVSLGLALTAIIIARLGWRLTAGRRLAAEGPALTRVLSRIVHGALYVLLFAQVGLGFGLEWLSGHAPSFFGLFDIPSPLAVDRALGQRLEGMHGLIGKLLMLLAAGHAVAALVHHYGMRDGVLARMLPAGRTAR